MWNGGKRQFYGPLSREGAPAIAERHLCFAGDEMNVGFGPQGENLGTLAGIEQFLFTDPNVSRPSGHSGLFDIASILPEIPISLFSAAAAPFTGGASLALPFALHGAEDAFTGDFSKLPGQAIGDAVGALGGALSGGGINNFFSNTLPGWLSGGAGGAAGGALSGVADTGIPEIFRDAAGGFGGAPGALAGPLGDIGAGGQAGLDALSGLPDLLSGGAAAGGGALGGALGGSGFGGGMDGSEGNLFSPMPTTPSIAPGQQGAIPDVGPIGSGGSSAYSGAYPYGTSDPTGGGIASGEATARPDTFGQGIPGATGTSAPALDPNANIDQQIADWSQYGQGGAAAPAAGGAAPGATGGLPPSGVAGQTVGNQGGLFGGLTDFLNQNKGLISLGTGALGVGNAIWKNSQMQGGIDALIKQAQQAQMFMGQFQQGYNQLLQQAIPLIQQGANGQINPGQAASLMAAANRMKTEIRAKYASMGGTGGQSGTNLQQDLNNVNTVIQALQQTMALGQLEAGVRVAGSAGGFGGLNQGALSSVGQFARLNAASDQELTNALGAFARAATSFGS